MSAQGADGPPPVGVCMCDRDGYLTYFNGGAAELWGRAPALPGTERFCGAAHLWWPDGRPMPHDQTPMAVAVRTGIRTRNQPVVIGRPDGQRTLVLMNAEPLLDGAGRVVGAMNAFAAAPA